MIFKFSKTKLIVTNSMKNNTRIVTGLVLLGIGGIALIYGLYQENHLQRVRENCQRLGWWWQAPLEGCQYLEDGESSISLYLLVGASFLGIGGSLIVWGKRALSARTL
jgi:hypothetical protein